MASPPKKIDVRCFTLHPVEKWFLMFLMLRKRVAPSGLLPERSRLPAASRRALRQAAGCSVVFGILFAAGTAGVSAPTGGEARLDFMSTDDGLTRESIAAISRPDPVRATPPPKTAATNMTAKSTSTTTTTAKSTAATRRRTRLLATTSARHHRQWRHRHLARQHEDATPPAPTPAVHPRRNLVVRFVVWWNGMVIRNFHTRFGTVKLDSWGADT